MQQSVKNVLLWSAVCLGWVAPSMAADEAAAPPDFARDVAPLLTKYCAGCHNDGDPQSDFSVESYGSLQKGTGEGPAFLAGDAANSRMVRVLTGGEPQMPPADEPRPSEEEIAILTRWIDAGAKGPEGAEPDRLMLVVPDIESHVDRRPVTALAASADGLQLAVARYGEVAIFDGEAAGTIATATPTVLLKDFPGKVNGVHFAADGKRLVTASGVAGLGGVAALWDVADGRLIREFRGHRDLMYDAELSPDGTLLATCSYDKAIILWNVESGEQIRSLDGHNGAVYDVAFSPDGTSLVSASADDTCKVWRVSDGERLDTLGEPLQAQYTCTFSPDGKTIVAGGADNRIRVWEFLSMDRPRINPLLHARFAHEGSVLRVAFTSDGSKLVSIADDKTVKLWETGDYTELRMWKDQPDVAVAVAVNEADQSFRIGRLDGSLDQFPLKAKNSRNRESGPADVADARVPIEDTTVSQAAESEPNDSPMQATAVDAPATITGVIHREVPAAASNDEKAAAATAVPGPSDFDLYRFAAKAGQEWVIEVNAARSTSPLDSYLEVLTSDGERIERVLLQAVRDSYFTFRGKNADQVGDFRIFNWQEMTLNEYLYANGEVVKLWMYPRGPDSGYNVYPGDGLRWGYFDTTPLSHALGEPCFIVEPHPPGSELIPNGLPVFTLYYENDDESRRTLGKDSQLFFTAPHDGEYLVKIKDVRGEQGPDFKYTLTVRPRRQDFRVSLVDKKMAVSPGSAKEFRVRAERIDRYDGPIRVDVSELPEGFTATTPLTIQAGQIEAMGVIMAAADAPATAAEQAKPSIAAAATILGEVVVHPVATFEELTLAEKPKLEVAVRPAEGGAQPVAAPADGPLEFTITPGETIMLKAVVQRNDFDGEVSLGKEDSGRNLPHGLYVDNIGLNGLLLLSGQTEREFFITADDWVPEQTRLFHLTTGAGGGQATHPVLLHVKRDGGSGQQASR